MKAFFSLVSLMVCLFAQPQEIDIVPFLEKKNLAHIKILDQKYLAYKKIGSIHFSEISDLAYDAKKKRLTMLSDEGRLFTFEASFSEKIDTLKALKSYTLSAYNGKAFKGWKRDSEGMCMGSGGGLLISFEGDTKLGLFDEEGRELRRYTLPKVLQNSKNYRSPNKSLEALARDARYGALMAAEWPLKKDDKKLQTIYSLSGRTWHYKAEPEDKSATTAIEVMDDGNLLVLERSFVSLLDPFVVTLKKVYLNGCKQGDVCKSKVLLKMNSHKGWDVDNFEGLTRVGKNRYLIVSDDNDNFFQKTLLIYFEVVK